MKKIHIYILCGCVLCACSDSGDSTSEPLTFSDVPIQFSTDMTNLDTRATTGPIESVEALQNLTEGFGVFAYMTGTGDVGSDTYSRTWETATKDAATLEPLDGDDANYPIPDFMYNQQVTWYLLNDGSTYGWTYSPPKYWPNSTENATSRPISFFAYAPYTSEAEAATADATGITGMTDANDKSPHVDYTLNTIGNQVDLLWACKKNGTRNGEGLIYFEQEDDQLVEKWQTVPLEFKHALACLDFYVQRVYDEEVVGGDDGNVNAPDNEQDTKIFVSQLTLTPSSNCYQTGRLSLEDGTWSGTTLITDMATPLTFNYTASDINPLLSGTTSEVETDIQGEELNKWSTLWTSDGTIDNTNGTEVAGVIETARRLNRDGRSLYLIPHENVTFTPTLSYSYVTRDNALEIDYLTDQNDNRYHRITHTVTNNPITLHLEGGYRYIIRCLIGVEHVSFEVSSVEDWDFPLRFTTQVTTPDNTSLPMERVLDEE